MQNTVLQLTFCWFRQLFDNCVIICSTCDLSVQLTCCLLKFVWSSVQRVTSLFNWLTVRWHLCDHLFNVWSLCSIDLPFVDISVIICSTWDLSVQLILCMFRQFVDICVMISSTCDLSVQLICIFVEICVIICSTWGLSVQLIFCWFKDFFYICENDVFNVKLSFLLFIVFLEEVLWAFKLLVGILMIEKCVCT